MATFKEAIITCVQEKYVSFKGRASRSEYWYFILFYALISTAASLADKALLHGMGILPMIVSLGLMLPTWAVSFRRMHDLGKSGWWIAGFSILFGTLNALFVVSTQTNLIPGAILNLCALLFLGTLIWLIIWLARKGDPQPNKYGDVPIS